MYISGGSFIERRLINTSYAIAIAFKANRAIFNHHDCLKARGAHMYYYGKYPTRMWSALGLLKRERSIFSDFITARQNIDANDFER